ncbi:HPr family phosphocarrier protein [Xylanimonas allomyrinae]|uniref:Phosphocarrier protein HPr n=1 Tax=Xylanimonas allomyrinae TaxID=2509459 RepID=A0A4P6EMN7_9MICO|nr:HPr family phosphocarrier protein [Xylanimonas allomyrinae]QAY63606.1 HPr family phosphocarrier protein [Xylanimonas allomyrinae]
MLERPVTVAILEGLHARPAALFAQLAASQPVQVSIVRPGGDPVPAASVLGVMSLGAKVGDTVTLFAADEASAQESLDTLAEFLLQREIA